MISKKFVITEELSFTELVVKTECFCSRLNKYNKSDVCCTMKTIGEKEVELTFEHPRHTRRLDIICSIEILKGSFIMSYAYNTIFNFLFVSQFLIAIVFFFLGFFELFEIHFINDKFWFFGILIILDIVFYYQLYSRATYYHSFFQKVLVGNDSKGSKF